MLPFKAVKLNFSVVLFIILSKVVVAFESVNMNLLGSTQKFRRVDWTINLSLIAKFLVLGSIGDHWS